MPYDSIGVKESTPLSVSRSVLASDYLRISEGFFRLNRSLVFPDGINVADASELVKENAVLASDALLYDSISYKGTIQVNALDKLVADYISYTKTYSPILFTLLAYRVRPRYLTLLISDYNIIKDSESYIKMNVVSVSDRIVYDSIISSKATQINIVDKLIADTLYAKNETLLVSDRIAYDSIDYNKAVQVRASDSLFYDSTSYAKTYSPILFTMLAYRVRPRYLTLSIPDYFIIKDGGSYIKIESVLIPDYKNIYDNIATKNATLLVLDYILIKDYFDLIKSNNIIVSDSIFYDNILTKNIALSVSDYKTVSDYGITLSTKQISVSDYFIIKDSGSYVKIKVVSVSDYNIGYDYRPLAVNRSIVVNDYKTIYDKIIATKPKTLSAYDKMGYDYVPSMNLSSVHFMSIYPNPSTFSILVSDYGVFYDTATARRQYKPVVVLDVIGVKDGVSIAKRSVVAYDKLVADSVALNKV